MSPKLLRLAVAALVLAPGAAHAQLSCATPQKPMVEVELMFGRNIGGKPGMTDAQWRALLTREVTPRLLDGLTVVDATGQWRDEKTKALVRERSKVVRIILPADAQASVDAGRPPQMQVRRIEIAILRQAPPISHTQTSRLKFERLGFSQRLHGPIDRRQRTSQCIGYLTLT